MPAKRGTVNFVILTEEGKYLEYLHNYPEKIRKFLEERGKEFNMRLDEALLSEPFDLVTNFSKAYQEYYRLVQGFQELLLEIYQKEGQKVATETGIELARNNIDLLKDLYQEMDKYVANIGASRVETIKQSVIVLIDLNDWLLGNWSLVDTNQEPEFRKLIDNLLAHTFYSWLCLALVLRALGYEASNFKQSWNNFVAIVTWIKAYSSRLEVLIDTANMVVDPSKLQEIKESLRQIDEGKTEKMDFDEKGRV